MQELIDLLRRQRAAGLPDLAGAAIEATLPVTDRLLNEVIAARLPPAAPVSEVRLRAHAGNQIEVRARVTRASFLPPISVTLRIVRQPELPNDPELVLEMASGGLLAMAGPVLRFLEALPPGIRLEGQRLHVNLAVILQQQGLGAAWPLLEDVRVTTEEQRVILHARARVRPSTS